MCVHVVHKVKCVEFATIITYHYVNQVTYGLPVSQIETTSLNCEEAIKKPLISQRLIIRLHILNTLATFSADIHFIVDMYFSPRCVGFFYSITSLCCSISRICRFVT